MPDQSCIKIRFGHPGLAALSIVFFAAVELSLFALAASAATAATMPGAFRIFFGLLAVIVLAGGLVLVPVLVRNPRLVSRRIVVTPEGVLLPARRFGLIPTPEIAGVGLLLQRNPRNGLPGGNWVLAVWRRDGSRAYAGGLQRRAQLTDPSDSRIAQAARQLYEVVLKQQGSEGPLACSHLQRNASFGPFESFTASWDPSVTD